MELHRIAWNSLDFGKFYGILNFIGFLELHRSLILLDFCQCAASIILSTLAVLADDLVRAGWGHLLQLLGMALLSIWVSLHEAKLYGAWSILSSLIFYNFSSRFLFLHAFLFLPCLYHRWKQRIEYDVQGITMRNLPSPITDVDSPISE